MNANKVFLNVDSPEFVTQFVQHEVPVVAAISSLMVRLRENEIVLDGMKEHLSTLREDEQRHLAKLQEDEEYNRLSTGKYLCCMYDV